MRCSMDYEHFDGSFELTAPGEFNNGGQALLICVERILDSLRRGQLLN